MKWQRLLVPILCFLALAGCKQQTPDQLLKTAMDAEPLVHKHHIEKDPKAARKAAKKAWHAALRLHSLARQSTNETLLAEQAGKAMTHARAARDEADLATEEWEYSKAMNGFVARSYRKARGPIRTGLVNKLADAADAASTNDVARLSTVTRELAAAAELVAELVNLDAGMNDSSAPDWARIASLMRSCSSNPPPGLSLVLACGFMGIGNGDLAVVEMESVSKDQLRTTNDFLVYHGGLCLVYIMRGWTQLAAPEFAAVAARLGDGKAIDGRVAASLYHAYLAIEAGSQQDLLKLDTELASAVSAWPENPWLAFVSGERLAADGRWEEAAESLEKEAKGTQHEWAARRMAQRARDLRDGKGNTESLVLDAAFLSGFALDWATTSGKDTPAGKRIAQLINSGKNLAGAVLQKLPLIGSKETQASDGGESEGR